MKVVFELFDRLTNMIPPALMPLIRLAALLVWVVLATIAVYFAWQNGAESAAQMGQELSLAEIKARQEREANLKKRRELVIPDLNDLIPEREREAVPYEYETGRPGALDLAGEDARLREPPNPVRGAEQPTYQGDMLAPRDTDPDTGARGTYVPFRVREEGVGGVRERADTRPGSGPVLPLDGGANGTGLDGRPLGGDDADSPARAPAAGPPPSAVRDNTGLRESAPPTRESAPNRRAPANDLPEFLELQ